MKRIGVLTAGGDTPALNATIHGVVTRANARRVEVYGLIKGFNSLLNPAPAARASESALRADSGVGSDQRRHTSRRIP